MIKNLMNKRSLIRIATFVIAAFVVMAGFIVVKCREAKIYKIKIENGYQHSLDELNSSMQNINVALEKIIYATSPTQISTLTSEILKDATIAKSNLSILPSQKKNLDSINKFLTQTGDYCAMLSNKAIGNQEITREEKDNIINLKKTSDSLSGSVSEVTAQYEDGGFWSTETSAMLDNTEAASMFGNTVYNMEDTFTSYPSLLYDGPFSDHILKSEPILLKGKKGITREEALEEAAEFLMVEKSKLKFDGMEEGKIKAYRFEGDNLTISITEKGGEVLYFRKYRPIGNATIDYSRAIENALSFATRFGNYQFKESYYFTDEGMCTVNLAYIQGDTICYTDLIKIGVAMDTGEILMFESTGFIMNHNPRTINAPKHTVEDAKLTLSDDLKVISVKNVLIPSPGTLSEYHCYEFYCTGLNDRELLIYVDCDNLSERDIQLLLRADGGTMTK